MRPFRPSLLIASGLALGLLLGGTTVAIAATSGSAVKVCTTSKGVVRSASSSGTCPQKTTKTSVAVKGPAGPRGVQGVQGPRGDQGVQGTPGPASTDFYRAFSADPGPLEIATVDGVLLTVNCTATAAVSWGYPITDGVKVRVSGTTSVGGGAPTSVVATDSPFLPFVQNATSVSASYVVTNMTTRKSFTYSITGTRSQSDCVFSGQITQ